jgi:hypothetical protein
MTQALSYRDLWKDGRLYGAGDLADFSDRIVRMFSLTTGITIASSRGNGPQSHPYVSLGVGLHSLRAHYSPAYWPPYERIRPGFTVAAGIKGMEGHWSPRVEVRVHGLVPVQDGFAYPLGNEIAWIVQASMGVQFP